MRQILLFLLIALCCSWNDAKAQEPTDIAGKIQQNWAFPDCGRTRETVVFTRHFYIDGSQKEMTLLPYALEKGGADYDVASIDGEDLAFRIEEDGILKAGWISDKAKQWSDLALEDKKEYTACAAVPAVMPKAMIRLLRYLDRMQEKCTLSIDNDCARVMFKLADENSDGKLTSPEIRKAVMSALLLGALGDKKTVTDKDMKSVAAHAKTAGPEIAADLLARYDADKSKSLDFNELVTDFTPPQLPVIKETLKKTGKLMPVFGMAAATLD